MRFPLCSVALAGAVAVAVPSLVSASVPEVRLSHSQTHFIQEVDDALGTDLLEFAQTPSARPFMQAAYLVCGQQELQEQILTALGANHSEMKYAMDRFEGGFCPGC